MAKLSQEELLGIFKAVKSTLSPCEKGSMKARFDLEGKYDLWSEKDLIDPLGKKRKEISFATAIIQSSYVGFYFMPVYCCPAMIGTIDEDLMKLLKGKACFHIKSAGPELIDKINDAVKKGYAAYKKLGWVD